MPKIAPHDVVCLVLCAGKGTRMRPLTYTRPKQLLPICNRPVIDHILSALSDVGIVDVCLVVDPGADALRAHIKAHRPTGLRTRFVVQTRADGIADAVRRTRRVVGSRPFIVYLGDSIYGDRIAEFVQRFVEGYPRSLMRLQEVTDPRQYGVAVCNRRGRVLDVEEKPDEPRSNLAITGLYGFDPRFFEAIRHTKPGKGGELQITDAIRLFLPEEPGVYREVYRGIWADAGRPGVLLEANDALLRELPGAVDPTASLTGSRPGRHVRVGANSRIVSTTFRGPVLIGENCRLTNAVVTGPCAINDDAIVTGSVLRNVILDRGARVEGMSGGLRDSILGIEAELQGSDGEAVANAVLGDGSRVRLDGSRVRCGRS